MQDQDKTKDQLIDDKELGFKRVPIHRDLLPILERIGKVRTLGSDSLWQWG